VPSPEKAYKNLSFLNSPPARHIRLLCEYEEPRQRFEEEDVHDTIVMFGSARVRSPEDAAAAVERALRDIEAMHDPADVARARENWPVRRADDVASTARALEGPPREARRQLPRAREELARAQRVQRLSRYYADTRELAARLTRWSLERTGGRRYVVCSGGGPGIMEASNRGAQDVEGGRSIGLGISLPFEEKVNQYVSPELAFQFHYFFMRKYWFAYLAKAMVILPGGFGTFDELFEILTLRQTGKITKPLPMVLFGTEYWSSVMNLEKMVEWGTIAERDLDLMFRTDSVDDAFTFLTQRLEENERESR
jgi:uncharacterized protein (TIGR00730 family)